MNPWWAKGAALAGCVVMIAIRAPHGQRSRSVKVAESRKGTREIALLTVALMAFLLPLVWVASPALTLADYGLRPLPFAAGVAILWLGLWVFHRSHQDLGTMWSITLEVRENHRLVTTGVYRHLRHPMYLSLLLYSLGQALILPNWIAGPAYAVAMTLIFAFRLGPEERMMAETFGGEYEAWRRRSKRLLPGIW